MRILVRALGAVAFGWLGTLVSAQAAPPELTTFTLDNGLQVVLAPMHRVPKVAVTVLVKVGSVNEPAGRSGFAHLFEHLMSSGTEAYPKFDTTLLALGIQNNAQTEQDDTIYWEAGLASTLPVMLSVEADRLANLGRNVDQNELDTQRKVVENEMRQRILDQPGASGQIAIQTALYPAPHPYSRHPIGSMADIDAATLDDVKGFFATYYVPNNAILSIAGDFDVAAAKALIEQTYGKLPRGADVAAVSPATPAPAKAHIAVEDALATPTLVYAMAGPRQGTKESYAAAVLSDLLGNYEFGYLRQRLVNTGIAAYAYADWTAHLYGGVFEFGAAAAPGVAQDKLEAELKSAVADFLAKPVALADLDRTRHNLLLSNRRAVNSVLGLDESLAYAQLVHNDAGWALRDNPYLVALTTADVEAAAHDLLAAENTSELVETPGSRGKYPDVLVKSSGAATPIVAPERAAVAVPVLQAGTPEAPTLPVAQTAMLSNGVKVVSYEVPDQPIVYVSATFTGGTTSDPPGKEELTDLGASMTSRGGGDRDFDAFSKAAKDIGADVSELTTAGLSNVYLSVPPDSFSDGVKLLADGVRRPRFDPDTFEVLKNEVLNGLAQQANDPDARASQALNMLMTPPGPGEPANDPTISSVKSITLDEAKASYAKLATPKTLTLYTAGSLPLAAMLPALEAAFGDWKSDVPGLPQLQHPPAVFPAGRHVYFVPAPGASLAILNVARPAPNAWDKLAPSTIATSQLLGGDFLSRLNTVIREQKGYSYGVSSNYMSGLKPTAALVVAAPVQTDKAGPALDEIFKGFASLTSDPVRQDELDRTATAVASDLASTAETSDNLINTLIDAADLQMTPDEEIAWQRAVIGLNLGDVQKQAAALSPLDTSLVVVTGDPDSVLPQLKALGIDDIQTVTLPQ